MNDRKKNNIIEIGLQVNNANTDLNKIANYPI